MRSQTNGATPDRDILERLEGGDPQALEMIWERHSGDLLVYLMSILCSHADAEDILQEVVVSIAQKHTAVARSDALRPYLFRMARNHALNFLKKRRRKNVPLADADRWLVEQEEDGTDEELAAQVTAALTALPEEQRSVIVLKAYQGRTFREIAEALEISENTAASRWRYGMEKLRSLL